MSEELCPSSADCPMPLPFFNRTSNQVAESVCLSVPTVLHYRSLGLAWLSFMCLWHCVSFTLLDICLKHLWNIYPLSSQGTGEARDFYVPNPSCREFHKYEWIGQLMGAALRGKDFLVSARLVNMHNMFYLFVCCIVNTISYGFILKGPGSSWNGVEAVDWRGGQLE